MLIFAGIGFASIFAVVLYTSVKIDSKHEQMHREWQKMEDRWDQIAKETRDELHNSRIELVRLFREDGAKMMNDLQRYVQDCPFA